MREIYFQASSARTKIDGAITFKSSILEIVLDSPKYDNFMTRCGIRDMDFWDTFFRHNNFHIEKNAQMFPEKFNKDLVRADSLTNLIEIWVSCKAGDIKQMLNSVKFLKDKYKLYREVPEYALEQAERFICPVVDARVIREPVTSHTPDIWFPVLGYLTLKEQLELAKVCRSLYSDVRHRVIGDVLVRHPSLDDATPLRKTLWMALVPQVDDPNYSESAASGTCRLPIFADWTLRRTKSRYRRS